MTSISLENDFIEAIAIGDHQKVSSLVSRYGIDPNMKIDDKCLNISLRLLNMRTVSVYDDELHFTRPLLFAVRFANCEMVELLLGVGAEIDKTDNFGKTACHLAVQWHENDTLAALLLYNPDLFIRNVSGYTALDAAIREDNEEATILLLRAVCEHTNIHELFRKTSDNHTSALELIRMASTNERLLRVLLEHDNSLNELRDENGFTLLHWAVYQRASLSVLKMLVTDCKIDVDVFDFNGQTPSMLATRTYETEGQLYFLIENGANVDIGHGENNLLCAAWKHKHKKYIVALLSARVNVGTSVGEGLLSTIQTSLWTWTTKLNGFSDCQFDVPLMMHGLIACSEETKGQNASSEIIRKLLKDEGLEYNSACLEYWWDCFKKTRLNSVRYRAMEICTSLQSLRLPALQMCEILQYSCGRLSPIIPFHCWWKIATTVKHFHDN